MASRKKEQITDEIQRIYQVRRLVEIDWFRHAESCSNVEINQLSDEQVSKSADEQVAKSASGVPETSFLGSFFSSSKKVVESAVKVSEPFLNKALQLTSQPPLTELGMYQAGALGDYIDASYYGYYTSPSIRTILTMMIALESKHAGIPRENIRVRIVKEIAEHQNYARYIDQDMQNKPLDPHNLKIIVNYFRNWLNNNYFNYYSNVDKKFMDIYNQVEQELNRLTRDDKHDDLDPISDPNIANVIQKFKDLDNCLNPNSPKRKIDLLKEVIQLISRFVPNFSVDLLGRFSYYTRTDRFDFIKFKFLDISTEKILREEVIASERTDTDIEKFIKWCFNHSFGKILCISHGSLLKEHFQLKRKLYNTEKLQQYYDGHNAINQLYSNIDNQEIVTRSGIISSAFVLKQIEKCGKICGNPQYIKDKSEENKLFAVVSKMSMYKPAQDLKDFVVESDVDTKFRIVLPPMSRIDDEDDQRDIDYGDFKNPRYYNNKSQEDKEGYFKKYINILK
jgi:broad specificity phosphatase PhoE